MAQFGRPDQDVSNVGLWTTAPLWDNLNDNNDADYITSPVNASGAQCELGLNDLGNPGVTSGHVLRVRARKNVKQAASIQAQLYQGGTLIASTAATDPTQTSFSTYTYNLTSGEAGSISNYNDLRIRLTGSSSAGGVVDVAWCELEIPDAAPVEENVVMNVATNMG